MLLRHKKAIFFVLLLVFNLIGCGGEKVEEVASPSPLPKNNPGTTPFQGISSATVYEMQTQLLKRDLQVEFYTLKAGENQLFTSDQTSFTVQCVDSVFLEKKRSPYTPLDPEQITGTLWNRLKIESGGILLLSKVQKGKKILAIACEPVEKKVFENFDLNQDLNIYNLKNNNLYLDIIRFHPSREEGVMTVLTCQFYNQSFNHFIQDLKINEIRVLLGSRVLYERDLDYKYQGTNLSLKELGFLPYGLIQCGLEF